MLLLKISAIIIFPNFQLKDITVSNISSKNRQVTGNRREKVEFVLERESECEGRCIYIVFLIEFEASFIQL